MHQISKKYTFESSHIVSCQTREPRKCALSIHGHSYQLIVTIETNELKNGFVLDYGYMDDIIKPIVDAIDHSFMIGLEDKINPKYSMLFEFFNNNNFRVFFLEQPYTTAEYIAMDMWKKINNLLLNMLDMDYQLIIEIKETEKTAAKYTNKTGETI